jgi:sarcosine oxidase delta subunit
MSIRNNEERFGATPVQGDAPLTNLNQETAHEEKPPITPLSFSTPTEFVDLPSKGLYYPEGHPLHGKESIEIRFMTAKDEDILTSKSLLKKGIAIDRLLQNIIVDKSINLNTLLTGDKNAIIVAARVTGYGSSYQTKIACPSCGESSKVDFDLEGGIVKESQEIEDVEDNGDGTFVATTPRGQIKVKMKLLDGMAEKNLSKLTAAKKKNNQPESTLSDQLRMAITAVEGQEDQMLVNAFIKSLPASDARYLRDVYAKKMPNVDLKHDYECQSCGYEQEMEVPFTSDFFWPK